MKTTPTPENKKNVKKKPSHKISIGALTVLTNLKVDELQTT